MAYRNIDIVTNPESKAILNEVRKFSMEVMRPAGIELDKYHDPEDVVAAESVLWKVFRTYRELDLHLIQIPKALV